MNKWFILLLPCLFGCTSPSSQPLQEVILPGAYQTDEYIPILTNKKVGVVVNHSSVIGDTHLVDSLINQGIKVSTVFTPEHGFTGTISDGESIEYEEGTEQFELVSLYGKNKKPSGNQIKDLDVIVFDIQDVGTRFYTYISTMHYVMEACAENNVPLIILDRPNPNGSYVDGPILDTAFTSFVGMHPIPIVHGLTVGELAQMINGERWLSNGVICELKIVKIKNWDHSIPYSLPVKPSPNLPDDLSISLYPSLCLFEGTIMSVGRGTDYAFQQIGHPDYPDTTYSFIPVSREGAKWPPYENKKCYGLSWIGSQPDYQFSLEPLIDTYNNMKTEEFFNDYFDKLAGSDQLRKQIKAGLNEEKIRKSWEVTLTHYKTTRANYLLYSD